MQIRFLYYSEKYRFSVKKKESQEKKKENCRIYFGRGKIQGLMKERKKEKKKILKIWKCMIFFWGGDII